MAAQRNRANDKTAPIAQENKAPQQKPDKGSILFFVSVLLALPYCHWPEPN